MKMEIKFKKRTSEKKETLKDWKVGTVLKHKKEEIYALVIYSCSGIKEEYTEDEKALLILDNENDFFIATGYFLDDYKEGKFEAVGRISDIEVER